MTTVGLNPNAQPGWLMEAIGGAARLSRFVNELKLAELPSHILPLVHDRRAFAGIEEGALESYCKTFDQYPEILSRYGQVIRAHLHIEQPCPIEFVIKEAHVDISEAPDRLRDSIIGEGFEPDHFFTLNPAEYRDCFTLRFEIPLPQPSPRTGLIQRALQRKMEIVEHEIERWPGVLAYSEIESYRHTHKRKYQYTPPSNSALDEFPFAAGEFEPRDNPTGKKADVHVKIPGWFEEREDETNNKRRQILKFLFLSAGFYEIRSLSGNIIYTIQLWDIRRAKRIFSRLKTWADKYHCIKGVELEVCSHFWRKIDLSMGRNFASPIPRVVMD